MGTYSHVWDAVPSVHAVQPRPNRRSLRQIDTEHVEQTLEHLREHVVPSVDRELFDRWVEERVPRHLLRRTGRGVVADLRDAPCGWTARSFPDRGRERRNAELHVALAVDRREWVRHGEVLLDPESPCIHPWKGPYRRQSGGDVLPLYAFYQLHGRHEVERRLWDLSDDELLLRVEELEWRWHDAARTGVGVDVIFHSNWGLEDDRFREQAACPYHALRNVLAWRDYYLPAAYLSSRIERPGREELKYALSRKRREWPFVRHPDHVAAYRQLGLTDDQVRAWSAAWAALPPRIYHPYVRETERWLRARLTPEDVRAWELGANPWQRVGRGRRRLTPGSIARLKRAGFTSWRDTEDLRRVGCDTVELLVWGGRQVQRGTPLFWIEAWVKQQRAA